MPLSAVIFIVGFVAGCVLAFARHPVYGLMTYIATLYFDPAGQWWGHAYLPDLRWELLPAVITLVAMLMYRKRMPSPVFRSGAFRGFLVFVVWMIIQLPWVLDPPSQEQILTIWSKFLLVSIMICSCVDSWKNLRLVLWAHVLGCAYMGWTAYVFYGGGRFEGFGLGSIADANTGALQLATGFLSAASLFLAASLPVKALLLPAMGLIANGLIATESRGGFLALVCGGIAFVAFAPKTYRKRVLAASLAALICFLFLTSANFWHRVQTIQDVGAAVPGIDTGHGRLVVLQAQWRMFEDHPLGCGHACTEVLSPNFVPSEYLSPSGRRASHNTFMTMLVDHGVPGGLLYVALLWWIWQTTKRIAPYARGSTAIPSVFFPGIAGVMAAIVVADLFDQFLLLEVRIWFVSLLISYAHLLKLDSENAHEHIAVSGKLLDTRSA
jgi:O-antigen ligase